MGRLLAIDVGGTKIRHCLASGSRKGGIFTLKTDRGMGNAPLARLICSLIREYGADSVSLSVAGFVQGNIILRMPNIPKIRNFDAKKLIGSRMQVKVFVENDVKCMALAQWDDAGRKKDASFAIVAPGSGIGGAIVNAGRLVRGAHNTAGEFGHMAMAAGQDARFYDFESLSGGIGLSRMYYAKTGSKADAKQVMDVLEDGNARGITLWAARYFGAALANIANIIDPEEIIVAGSVGRAYCSKKLMPQARMAYEKNAIGTVKKTPIRICPLEEPALEGAILNARAKKDKEIAGFLL